MILGTTRHVIRVLEGPDAGRVLRLAGERAFVGTGDGAGLRLSDRAVSPTHVTIWPDDEGPSIEPSPGASTSIDGRAVVGRTRVRPGGRIRLSDRTVLVCVANRTIHAWWTAGALGVLLIATLGVLALPGPAPPDETRATPARAGYWTARQAAERLELTGTVPTGTRDLLDRAWRLERAGASRSAGEAWRRLWSIALVARATASATKGVRTTGEDSSLGDGEARDGLEALASFVESMASDGG